MRSRRLVVVVLVALVVVGIVAPVGLWYLRLHPFHGAIEDDPGRLGIAFEPVAFTSLTDGAPLRGWHMPAPAPTGRAIVIVPGIDDDRLVDGVTLGLAPTLLDAGFDVLAFDLRGEGESGGEPITFGAREQDDVLGAVALARARGAKHVGVLGFSLGAGASILATAASNEIDALVTDSAFAELTDTLRHGLEVNLHLPAPVATYALLFYPLLSGTDPATVSPVSVIGSIAPRPVLLIHGTADTTVPVGDSERLLRAAATATTERWLVEGGKHTHSYFVDPAAYTSRVTTFFETALR